MTDLHSRPQPAPAAASAGGPPPPGSSSVVPKQRPRRLVRRTLKHVLMLAASLAMIYPLLWMVVSSLRPNEEIFRNPSLWPISFNVENYEAGWNALAHPFSHYLMNSTLLVLGCVIGNLVACSLTAYAFARLKFWGRNIAFAVMLMTLMLPIHVVIVPQYIMFSQTGWVNTLLPLILPKFLATDAFFVFLMVQFIRGIPKELDEAARIDGAGHFRIFFQVILPLMLPALATTTIFTFMWMWNDFFGSLIYLTAPENFTVPLALRSFLDTQGSSDWGAMFAMSILSLIPLFLVFLFGQRFLVKGFATTGIK
jgi:multiple sugar transport system permease protein